MTATVYPEVAAYSELTGTFSAAGGTPIASTDVRGYATALLSVSGGGASNAVAIDFSNDATTWARQTVYVTPGLSAPWSEWAVTRAMPAIVPIIGRYMRVSTTNWVTGTTTVTVELLETPIPQMSGNGTLVSVAAQNSAADGNANSQQLPAGIMVNNLSSWDRVRSATAAAGTTGQGVLAAGVMGFDATNFQRLKVDTGGQLQTLGGYTEASGTMAAVNATPISQDVRGYARWTVQLTGTWVGVVAFQGSNDNATWVDLGYSVFQLGTTVTTPALNSGAATNGLFTGVVQTRYLRVIMTSRTSGTATATMELHTAAGDAFVQAQTAIPQPLVLADSTTNFTIPTLGAAPHIYNGTGWDRARDANSANGSVNGGTGVMGAGMLALDPVASRWRAAKLDGNGILQVKETCTTSAVTSVAASATSVNLLASNVNRRQAIITNDSTALMYVKLGATASTTSFTYLLQANGLLELPPSVYTGAIDAIWATATGSARVTELTT